MEERVIVESDVTQIMRGAKRKWKHTVIAGGGVSHTGNIDTEDVLFGHYLLLFHPFFGICL